MLTYLLALIGLLLPQEPVARHLDGSAARADLVLLREAVEVIHPGLGRYVPAKEFEQEWSDLHAALDNGTTDLDLYRKISVLMAGLRCGHTRVDAPAWLDEYRQTHPTLLPFDFRLFDGRMFVDSSPDGSPLGRGTEILRIDGKPVEELIEAIAATVPVDGWTDHVRPSRLQAAYEYQDSGLDHYLPLFAGFRERFELEVRVHGEQETSKVAVAPAMMHDEGWKDFVDAVSWRMADEATAVLRIGTFVNYRRPVDPEKHFARYFREIADSGVEHLVVDLRECGGGSGDVGWTLGRFLIESPMTVGGPRVIKNIRFGKLVPHLSTWVDGAFEQPVENFKRREDGWYELRGENTTRLEPHPDRFRGRITALIGPYNASGSTMLLAMLQEASSIELVGEPTGGSAEGPTAGILFTLTLPDSGIRVNLPVIRESSGVQAFRAGHGVFPDRLVRPQLADFLAERDVVLAAALSRAPTSTETGTDDRGATDWPQWRGPDRSGISPEQGWLSEGAQDPLWVADVGLGYSSPSIASGRLYTRGFFADDETDVTTCRDASSGEEIWKHASPAKLWDNMHGGGTLTTPVVDGDVVYVLSRMGSLTAHVADNGRVIWARQLNVELEVGLDPFGFCTSPLVLDDRVFVNVGKTVALEKATGKTIWETRDYGFSYATPEPFELGDRTLLAIFNGAGLTILDRGTGAEIALHPWTSQYNVNSASPIVIGNRIFISTGYNEKGCTLLELAGDELRPLWSSKKMNNKMNGCILLDDLLFGFDNGILRCLDMQGEVLWSERGLGKGSLIASDGRLIVLSEEGELIVAPVSPAGFEPSSRTKVFDEGVCWTTPVLSDGLVYLRNSAGKLLCRDHRAP